MKDKIENYFHLDSITEKIDLLQEENKELKKELKKQDNRMTLTLFICLAAIIIVFFAGLIWEWFLVV